MPDLTLGQVRKAGRFAWCPSQLFVDGRVYDADIGAELGPRDRESWYLDVRLADVTVPEPGSIGYIGGWHHLPGCDCELCHE